MHPVLHANSVLRWMLTIHIDDFSSILHHYHMDCHVVIFDKRMVANVAPVQLLFELLELLYLFYPNEA
jgi:hypothetical protein